MKANVLLIALLFSLALLFSCKNSDKKEIVIVPEPVLLERGSGVFKMDNSVSIHISDDQEDRPRNAREGQKPGELATYGGYYTQDEIRDIVAYADERFVTVVPGIEMPAHVSSALAEVLWILPPSTVSRTAFVFKCLTNRYPHENFYHRGRWYTGE